MDDGKFFACFSHSLRAWREIFFASLKEGSSRKSSLRGRQVRQGRFFGLKEEEGIALGLPKCSMFNVFRSLRAFMGLWVMGLWAVH